MKSTIYTKTKRTGAIHRVLYLLLTLMLVLGFSLMGCEGPQGPQGEQGSEGPVGPAGEDGSMMYAGEGAPGEDIGTVGDYYLNQNTGELYGPKDSDGWGDPIIVLMGEDGADGSQIHSGSGTPDASLGVEGDYYLNKDNYDLYGPKTSDGWGSPLNLKGADGNANVTRYIFPGHDYSGTYFTEHEIDVTEAEMEESAWEVYLVRTFSDGILAYHVPGWAGPGGSSQYRVVHETTGSRHEVNILRQDGPGEAYDNIYIVRIAASNTEDHTKRTDDNIIPDHLDVSNYEEVAEYYGFGGER